MNQLKITVKEPNKVVPNFYTKKIKIIKVKSTTTVVK